MKSFSFSLSAITAALLLSTVSVSCVSAPTPAPSCVSTLPAIPEEGTLIHVENAGWWYCLNKKWYYRGEEPLPLPTHISDAANPYTSAPSHEDNLGRSWNPATVSFTSAGSKATLHLTAETRHGITVCAAAQRVDDEYRYTDAPLQMTLSHQTGNVLHFSTAGVCGSDCMPVEPTRICNVSISTPQSTAAAPVNATPNALTGKTLTFSTDGAIHAFCPFAASEELTKTQYAGLSQILKQNVRPYNHELIAETVPYEKISFDGTFCRLYTRTGITSRPYTAQQLSPTRLKIEMAEIASPYEAPKTLILDFTSANGGMACDMGEEEDIVGNILFSIQ